MMRRRGKWEERLLQAFAVFSILIIYPALLILCCAGVEVDHNVLVFLIVGLAHGTLMWGAGVYFVNRCLKSADSVLWPFTPLTPARYLLNNLRRFRAPFIALYAVAPSFSVITLIIYAYFNPGNLIGDWGWLTLSLLLFQYLGLAIPLYERIFQSRIPTGFIFLLRHLVPHGSLLILYYVFCIAGGIINEEVYPFAAALEEYANDAATRMIEWGTPGQLILFSISPISALYLFQTDMLDNYLLPTIATVMAVMLLAAWVRIYGFIRDYPNEREATSFESWLDAKEAIEYVHSIQDAQSEVLWEKASRSAFASPEEDRGEELPPFPLPGDVTEEERPHQEDIDEPLETWLPPLGPVKSKSLEYREALSGEAQVVRYWRWCYKLDRPFRFRRANIRRFVKSYFQVLLAIGWWLLAMLTELLADSPDPKAMGVLGSTLFFCWLAFAFLLSRPQVLEGIVGAPLPLRWPRLLLCTIWSRKVWLLLHDGIAATLIISLTGGSALDAFCIACAFILVRVYAHLQMWLATLRASGRFLLSLAHKTVYASSLLGCFISSLAAVLTFEGSRSPSFFAWPPWVWLAASASLLSYGILVMLLASIKSGTTVLDYRRKVPTLEELEDYF